MYHELKSEDNKEIVNEHKESIEPILTQNNNNKSSSQSLVIFYLNMSRPFIIIIIIFSVQYGFEYSYSLVFAL